MLHHLRLHQPARLCSASKNNIENKLRTFHGIQLLLLATQIHLIQQIHGRHLLKFPEGGVVKNQYKLPALSDICFRIPVPETKITFSTYGPRQWPLKRQVVGIGCRVRVPGLILLRVNGIRNKIFWITVLGVLYLV